MRKLAITLALASTALGSPAVARDHSWYVGVEGGALLVEDTHFNYSLVRPNIPTIAVTDGVILNNKTGFDADIIGGYDFGMVRAEAEIGYKRAGVGDVGVNSSISGNNINVFNGQGHLSTLSSMINVMLDFGNDNGWSGSVGGGAGVARTKYNVSVPALGPIPNLVGSDSSFAWQAIAGVRHSLGSNIDLGIKYRLFTVPKLRFNDSVGQSYSGKLRSHSLLASLIFNFAPPPPPPPAPPPPPPPPPATQTCADGSVIPSTSACQAPAPVPVGPFIVFFDWDKSDVTPEAAAILDNAAAAYAQTGKASVMLAGHADRSGSDQYNVGLSQRRADAIRAYMAGKGVPDGAITSQAFGESRPLVATADGVREPQNRRVEITFGPGSGQ